MSERLPICGWCTGLLGKGPVIDGMHEACVTYGRDLNPEAIGYETPGASQYSIPFDGYFTMTNEERRNYYRDFIKPFKEVDTDLRGQFSNYSCTLDHRTTPHDCTGGK
jgi:hypothetical protein